MRHKRTNLFVHMPCWWGVHWPACLFGGSSVGVSWCHSQLSHKPMKWLEPGRNGRTAQNQLILCTLCNKCSGICLCGNSTKAWWQRQTRATLDISPLIWFSIQSPCGRRKDRKRARRGKKEEVTVTKRGAERGESLIVNFKTLIKYEGRKVSVIKILYWLVLPGKHQSNMCDLGQDISAT